MPEKLLGFVLVGIGGALGAMSRYGISNLGIFDHDKYYYTVVINISGCFMMGVLWALFNHWNLSPRWHAFFMSGILGGYTTYSAFTLDAMQLVQNGMPSRAFFYIAMTFLGGLGACYIAMMITEHFCKV